MSLQLVQNGTKALAAREMIVLSYMIFQYTPLVALSQRGVTIHFWVNWILRGGQQGLLRGVRTRLRIHSVQAVGMQLLAYAVLLLFWIVLYKDMSCKDMKETSAFFYYRLPAFGAFRWIVIGALSLYSLLLLYWLFDTVRSVHVNEKQAKWCQEQLQVMNGSKRQEPASKGSGPRGAFLGALMAVIDLGDARAQVHYGSRPTSAITEGAVAVEELSIAGRLQSRMVSALLFVWVVSNALAVEFLFVWNKIDDTSSLASFDQFFPFCMGVWAFMQSFFPPDDTCIDSEQAQRHVTQWCGAGDSRHPHVGQGKESSMGATTGAFLRHFV
jgi:hypothetical protein